ncbi:MAG: glycosyltransferase [bacterium]|nr:glycosyltransferase [bacterium]
MKNIRLSLIIPTFNSEKHLAVFFNYLDKQKFLKNQLEILIVDGGSKDKTLFLAKKYGAKIINNPRVLAEPGVTLGFAKATGDLLMVLATDNYLTDQSYLKKMVSVFDDKDIEAAISKIVSFPNDNFLNKYLNRFTDPFNHFVYGNACCLEDCGKYFKIKKRNSEYIVYDFNSKVGKPILAFAQGMTIRRGFKRNTLDAFDDIAPIYDLIKKNKSIAYVYDTYLVHNSLHSCSQFIRKQEWATFNALNRNNYGISHREEYLTFGQKFRMRLWPIYVLMIFPPILYSWVKTIVNLEPIWLYHPLMCYLSVFGSLKAAWKYYVKREKEITRDR